MTQKTMQENTRSNSNIIAIVDAAARALKSVGLHSALRHFGRANGVALMLAAVVCAGNVGAQTSQFRLGNPEVLSSLGSPLWVKIPVTIESAQSSEDLTAARFSLGARPANAPVPFVERAELTIEQAGGKMALMIRTRNSIDEPAIGVVLREALANGVRSREFFLLLDPAPLTAVPTAAPDRATAESDATRQQPTTVAPAIGEARPNAVAASTTQTAVSPRATKRKSRQADARAAARNEGARATAVPRGLTSILPTAKGRASPERSVSESAQTQGGPRLRLSFGEGLTTRPATTEAERAELRMRQFTLDMDDLTSGLLERQHKITQLEKELAGLSARVSAAERLIGVVQSVVPTPTAAPTITVPPATPTDAPPAAVPETLAPAPAPAPAIAKKNSERAVPSASTSVWTWLLVGAAMVAALATLAWGIRHMLRRRDQTFRLDSQGAEEYVAEVLAHKAPVKQTVAMAQSANKAATQVSKQVSTPIPAPTTDLDFHSQEIHFELPELHPTVDEIIAAPAAKNPASRLDMNVLHKPLDEATSRRMRYLQSRYHDIAILMPPIDAPQRLLRQAATVYDEGATDFAKRLLKFAAYSRPYTEEFWLALLELLYREKFASDYLVNAKWFRQYHAESLNWDEVVRIGYLLDASEPLFAVAAHWSHDEPSPGVWLPANADDKKPVAAPEHLKLEFTK